MFSRSLYVQSVINSRGDEAEATVGSPSVIVIPSGCGEGVNWLIDSGLEQCCGNLVPFGIKRSVTGRASGSTVPVRGIRQVSLDAMQVGMHPGSRTRLYVLNDYVAGFPTVAKREPECPEFFREVVGWVVVAERVLEFGERHKAGFV